MEEKMEFAINHRFNFLVIEDKLIFITEKVDEEEVMDEIYLVNELIDFLEGKPNAPRGTVLLALGKELLVKALKYGGIL